MVGIKTYVKKKLIQQNLPKTLNQLLTEVMALHPKKIDLSLGRMQRLLRLVGEPQKKLPATVQLAGTNGKGSTTLFLANMLQQLSYQQTNKKLRVDYYTSPHLVRFNERIVLAGKEVSDEILITELQKTLALNKQLPITFFELTTVVALQLFAKNFADVLLLEVGLGGRLDSTNVISKKSVAVFTPIDLDHKEFLGDSIEKIATEKAGIINADTDFVVTAPQALPAEQILTAAASAKQKPIIKVDYQIIANDLIMPLKNYRIFFPDVLADYQNQTELNLGRPSLLGQHQYMNAAVAVVALWALLQSELQKKQLGTKKLRQVTADWVWSEQQLRKGLANTIWPGRLQNLSIHYDYFCETLVPKISCGLHRPQIFLDGCHNAHGARALAHWLQQELNSQLKQSNINNKKIFIVTALLQNRSAEEFYQEFLMLPKAQLEFIAVDFDSGGEHHLHQPTELVKVLNNLGFRAVLGGDWQKGLGLALTSSSQTPTDNLVVIAGSLYLATKLLAFVPLDKAS